MTDTLLDTIKELRPKVTQGELCLARDKGYTDDSYHIGVDEFTTIAEVRHGAWDDKYGGEEAEKANMRLFCLTYKMADRIIADAERIEWLENALPAHIKVQYDYYVKQVLEEKS